MHMAKADNSNSNSDRKEHQSSTDAIVASHLEGLYLAIGTGNWPRLLEEAVLLRYMRTDIWVSFQAHMAAS